MKIITGVTKWRVADENGNLDPKVFGTQADAEDYGGSRVVGGNYKEALILAAVSKMIIPPVEAIRIDV